MGGSWDVYTGVGISSFIHCVDCLQEVEMLKVKASRVDKLQVELNSQRERLEEASRLSAKLKVWIVLVR